MGIRKWEASIILSGHQPVYLPGIILFNKIALCEKDGAFMFVGHCQYTPKSWHSHNFIRTGKLSVPVHKGPSINKTQICGDYWKAKHLKSIGLAYGQYPFFGDYFPLLKILWMLPTFGSLGTFNSAMIAQILHWLGIKTMLFDSSDFEIKDHKTNMLVEMCKAVGADEYLSNEGSRDHVDEELLAANGIKHHWQKFKDPDYGQKRLVIKDKEQPLSILDLLFSKGPEAGEIVKKAGYVD